MNDVNLNLIFPVCTFLLMALASGDLPASQNNVPDALLQCGKQKEDGKRLACFDAEIARLTAVAEAPITAERSPGVVSTATETAEVTTIPAKAAAAVAQNETAAPVAATSIDEFGMNAELASKLPDEPEAPELGEISATVIELRKRHYGEHVVTLDNGQIWAEKSSVSGFRVKIGDTVIIKRGAFGSYRMTGRGNRSSLVKRLK